MFIIATLLTPIGIGLFGLMAGYFASHGADSNQKVLVKDETHILKDKIKSNASMSFAFSDSPIDSLIDSYNKEGYDLLLWYKDHDHETSKPKYYTTEKLGILTLEKMESRLEKAIEKFNIEQSGIQPEIIDGLKSNISIENGADDSSNEKLETSSKLSVVVATMFGAIMAFLMYMVIFIYGGMVMRSVMEEKINRIVEVMISSVKPIQLMLGKIIGVGAVGLTQLAMWMILIPLVLMLVQLILGDSANPTQMDQITEQMNGIPQEALDNFNVMQFITEFKKLNWPLIIPSFIIFFFGGFFIYSSLFAAIGSAVGDDMGESQQLMIPVTMPVVLAIFIAQAAIQNPNGSLSIFGSMFPLFSPIIMPVRLAFNPPIWQVVVSVIILILSCVFFAWIAGRIYRIGILMYGKKVTFRELGKWLFYKG